MAVSPNNVATKGYLGSRLAVAVDGYLGGLIPSIPEGWFGGVVVLSNAPGVGMVAGAVSAIIMAAKTAILQVSQSLGYTIGPEPGAEVSDKEPGTDE